MVTLDLIPANVQFAMTKQRRLRKWVVSVLLSASLAIGALAVDWAHLARAGELSAENVRLQAQLARLRADFDAVTTESNQVLLRIERANALRAKRAWSGLIALVGSSMPRGCWLRSISTVPERPAPAPAHRRGGPKRKGGQKSQGPIAIDAPRKLKITGYAPGSAQPYEFVSTLKAVGVFRTVSLANSQQEPVLGGSYYRFELVCEW